MTLKGLIAPGRIAVLQWTRRPPSSITSLPALVAKLGVSETFARSLAAPVDQRGADHLCVRACAIPARLGPDRGGRHRRPADRRRMVRDRLSRRRRLQSGAGDVADLRRADRRHPAIRDAVDRADAEFRHRHGGRRVRRQPGDGAGDAALSLGRLQLAAPHAALDRRRGADGRRRRDGARLLGRAGPDRAFDAGAGVVRRGRRHFAGHRRGPARRAAGAAAGVAAGNGARHGRSREVASRITSR